MYIGNLRVFTPARIIDGSNKATTLGLRHAVDVEEEGKKVKATDPLVVIVLEKENQNVPG